jgi:hypothetical protein
MPSPHKFDPPPRASPLSCPDCFKLMRITVIELDDSRERIKLVCDDCGAEEVLTRPAE